MYMLDPGVCGALAHLPAHDPSPLRGEGRGRGGWTAEGGPVTGREGTLCSAAFPGCKFSWIVKLWFGKFLLYQR